MKVDFKGIWKWISDHSGTICAGVGVAGVGVTAYFSGKAAVEVHEKVTPEMEKKEKLKIYAKAYWKTLFAGLLTSGAIIGGDRINVGKLSLASSAAVMYKDKLLEIEKKVREKFGDEAFDEIKKEIQEEHIHKTAEDLEMLDDLKLSSEEVIVYIPDADSLYRTTPKRMFYALYETNYKLHKDQDVSLGYFCKKLGKSIKSFKTPMEKSVHDAMLDDLRWCGYNKEQFYQWEIERSCQHIDYIPDTYLKEIKMPDGTVTIGSCVEMEPNIDGEDKSKIRALYFTVSPIVQYTEDLV